MIETYRGYVYPSAIDHVGHMNVQFYTSRFDEASWHFLARLGLPPSYLAANRRGFVALDQHTQYKKEVLAGSLLDIKTELVEVRRKTIRYRHHMYNSETNEEVAVMELLVAYFDLENRASTELPAEVATHAAALPV